MEINLSDLKLNDQVFSSQHGIGKILDIRTYNSKTVIGISFINRNNYEFTESFYLDGRFLEEDQYPTLFHSIHEFFDFVDSLSPWK
jgi:hypothetical protein